MVFKYENFSEMVRQLAGLMATALMAQGEYREPRMRDLVNTLRSMFLKPAEIRPGFQDWTYAGFRQAIAKACFEAQEFYEENFCSFNRKEAKLELYQLVYDAQKWANEEEEPKMFEYFIASEDWDFGPDAATGEPTAWPVEVYDKISRFDALALIKAGHARELVIRPVNGKTDPIRNTRIWVWNETRHCLMEDLPF